MKEVEDTSSFGYIKTRYVIQDNDILDEDRLVHFENTIDELIASWWEAGWVVSHMHPIMMFPDRVVQQIDFMSVKDKEFKFCDDNPKTDMFGQVV